MADVVGKEEKGVNLIEISKIVRGERYGVV